MSDEKKVKSSLTFVALKPVLCFCIGFNGDPDPAFCRNTYPDASPVGIQESQI